MPGLNGVEATRRIAAGSPHITVVVLTVFGNDDPISAALRAIRGAANGEVIFGTQLAARMLTCFTTPASASPPVFPQLTDREREVLNLVAQDRANPAIAARLGCAITCRTSWPSRRPLNGPRPSRGPGTAVPGLRARVYRRPRERSRRTRDVRLMTAGQPPAEAVFSGRSGGCLNTMRRYPSLAALINTTSHPLRPVAAAAS